MKELLSLVLEAEYLLTWKKNSDQSMFLQFCVDEANEDSASNGWQGKVNKIIK